MLVDIDKIVVGDRIRKDFGDIQELADDIKENGLINPPVVNKEYQLLAGERRLRACRLLGWPQIEVRMMDTRDAEHELNIEISENDVRKGFTKSERVDYIRRLLRIEQAKAKERQITGTSVENSTEVGRSDEITAAAFGMKKDTMRRELFIADNADMLDPADFADWDEGRLSTNKAFQRIKAAQAQAERERKLAEQERDKARQDLAYAYRSAELMESEVASLKRQVAAKPQPEVIEREVVREVPPADYEAAKRKVSSLEHDNGVYADTNRQLRRQLEDTKKELDKAKDILGMDKTLQDVRRDVQYLTTATISYVRRYGGLTWTFEQLKEIDDASLEQLLNVVRNLATFSTTLTESLTNEYDQRHDA